MSIVQYSMTRVRSILFTLVCLALLVLPGQAVAGAGAAVTYSGQVWAEGAVVEVAR